MNDVEFIDLFAGIGGMRRGFEKAGGKCIFSSEIDRHARETYEENFGELSPRQTVEGSEEEEGNEEGNGQLGLQVLLCP